MNILTIDNQTFSMNNLPSKIGDVRFSVLDYTNPEDVDYIFIPLMFLEDFNSSGFEVRIGKHSVKIPIGWSIVIGDKHSGELELLDIKQINDRSFDAFILNPLTSSMPDFQDIEVTNIYNDVRWYFPRLKYGYLLTYPLSSEPNSPCVYITRDPNKINNLDIGNMI